MILELEISQLDLLPDGGGLLPAARADSHNAFKKGLLFIEKRQKSAVEAQSFMGGDAD